MANVIHWRPELEGPRTCRKEILVTGPASAKIGTDCGNGKTGIIAQQKMETKPSKDHWSLKRSSMGCDRGSLVSIESSVDGSLGSIFRTKILFMRTETTVMESPESMGALSEMASYLFPAIRTIPLGNILVVAFPD